MTNTAYTTSAIQMHSIPIMKFCETAMNGPFKDWAIERHSIPIMKFPIRY